MSEVPLYHQPSEGDPIVFPNCRDVYHKSPNSGERQHKSRTWERQFDPSLGAGGREHLLLLLYYSQA